MAENNDSGIGQIPMLDGFENSYGGFTVEVKERMDADVFAPLFRASTSSWKLQEGFKYHHAEPSHLILVCWLPLTPDTFAVNASRRVGVGAFVLNDKREVLVVQERNGMFQDTGVWKLPTGVLNEGDSICHAVVKEVKEEMGVDTKFVEVLCFRQSHKSFFTKSDLFFLCVLQAESATTEEQDVEIKAAKWMPIEEYAAQPFVVENKQFNFMANICLAKADHCYPGSAVLATTAGVAEGFPSTAITPKLRRTWQVVCNSWIVMQNFFLGPRPTGPC
ncbi:hypothetical protein EUGRSUZ_H00864 [Eucalyptus grandis]|uniref:Uncharacterized protein n=1 Tax=Eucalyptus grandis TaxID=71139 RepID=A0ACC3JNP1_EUCGR|nr:hypothetical protein EUGRSUZ_H00864 [Eucalyptus grandis]